MFTTQLDFGQQYATTAERHLEIEVRRERGASCADLNGFILMDPRQMLTATPMAAHADSAFALDAADGNPLNAVYVDNGGKVGFGTAGSPHFSIVNARSGGNINLEAVTITSAGAVGIGTAAPAATLDVRGDI